MTVVVIAEFDRRFRKLSGDLVVASYEVMPVLRRVDAAFHEESANRSVFAAPELMFLDDFLWLGFHPFQRHMRRRTRQAFVLEHFRELFGVDRPMPRHLHGVVADLLHLRERLCEVTGRLSELAKRVHLAADLRGHDENPSWRT